MIALPFQSCLMLGESCDECREIYQKVCCKFRAFGLLITALAFNIKCYFIVFTINILTDCLADWRTDCLTDRVTDWLFDCLLTNWEVLLTDWLMFDWLNDSESFINWLADCLIGWLTVQLTAWLIKKLTEYLLDWLIGCLSHWLTSLKDLLMTN